MMLEKNIGAALLEVAGRMGSKPAVAGDAGALGYEGLGRLIVGLASVMRDAGVERGSCVAIEIDDRVGALVAIAACSLLGAAWTEGADTKIKVVADLVTHTLFDKMPPIGARVVGKAISFNPNQLGMAAAWGDWTPPGYESEASISRIGLSSGSTGTRKAVWISAGAEWNRTQWQYEAAKDIEDLVTLCLFATKTGVGANTRLRTLLHGGTVIEGIVLKALEAGVVNQVVGSPFQYSVLLTRMENARITTKLPLALVGGGRPSPEFLDKMRERFKRISVFYGSTEMGNIAEYPKAARNSYDGRLSPRTDVRIVDENGDAVPAGTPGQIVVKSKGAMTRYSSDEDNEKSFSEGWFHSGDMGTLSKEGYLYIEGRNDDRANIGGVKVNMLCYDDAVQAFPGIVDGYCFLKPDRIGIEQVNVIARFAEPDKAEDTAAKLLAKMRKTDGVYVPPVAIYASEAVPRTDTGKPMKAAALELSRQLTPVAVQADATTTTQAG